MVHLEPPSKSSPNQANVEEEDGQTNAGNSHLEFQTFLFNTNCVSFFVVVEKKYSQRPACR